LAAKLLVFAAELSIMVAAGEAEAGNAGEQPAEE
jgi:hypothetical protein